MWMVEWNSLNSAEAVLFEFLFPFSRAASFSFFFYKVSLEFRLLLWDLLNERNFINEKSFLYLIRFAFEWKIFFFSRPEPLNYDRIMVSNLKMNRELKTWHHCRWLLFSLDEQNLYHYIYNFWKCLKIKSSIYDYFLYIMNCIFRGV